MSTENLMDIRVCIHEVLIRIPFLLCQRKTVERRREQAKRPPEHDRKENLHSLTHVICKTNWTYDLENPLDMCHVFLASNNVAV